MAATDQSSIAFSQSKIIDWVMTGTGSEASNSQQIQPTARVYNTRSMNNPPERIIQDSKKIKKAKQKNQRKNKSKNSARNLSGESSSSSHSKDSLPQSRSVEDMLADALNTQTNSNPSISSTDPSPEEELSRVKAYTEHLEAQIESLKSERDLLNDELKSADKIMNSLKQKNKKLTEENDKLLRNASKTSGTRRFTDISTSSIQTDPAVSTREANDINIAKLSSMCDQAKKLALDLINTANSLQGPDANLPNLPSSSSSPSLGAVQADTHSDEPFLTVQSRRKGRAPQQQNQTAAPPSYAHVAGSQRQRQGQGTRYRNRKKIIIIGTSLTDGISSELRCHDIDSTTYRYGGHKIDLIRDRVPHLFSKDVTKQPDKILVLAGGNDAEETTADRTMNSYEGLVRDIRKVCPQSKILISSIPPRKNDNIINNKIKEVNEYLADRGQRNDNVQFVDVVPKEPKYFTSKKVHFKPIGISLLASRLKPFLVD